MNNTPTGNGTSNHSFSLDFMDNYFKLRAAGLKGVLTKRKNAGPDKGDKKWQWYKENWRREIEIESIEDLAKHFKGQFTNE